MEAAKQMTKSSGPPTPSTPLPRKSTPPRRLLLAIITDGQDRVLFTQTPRGEIHLPGGASETSKDSRKILSHLLRKFVYQQTGIMIGVQKLLGSFTFAAERKKRQIRAYVCIPTKGIPDGWKLKSNYAPLWFSVDDALGNPHISREIKELLDHLLRQKLPVIGKSI